MDIFRKTPSKLFNDYIASDIGKITGERYAKDGMTYINCAGSFIKSLWNGDLDNVFAHADSENIVWLEETIGIKREIFSAAWRLPIVEGAKFMDAIAQQSGYDDGIVYIKKYWTGPPTMTISFTTNNASFRDEDDNLIQDTVIGQIKSIATMIKRNWSTDTTIMDINGNAIGKITLTEG